MYSSHDYWYFLWIFWGRVDDALSMIMNIMLVIPQYPLLFVIAAFIGEAGPLTIAIMIGCTSWAWGARVIRSQTLALREKEFIQAAEVIGESPIRIIFIEIFPNLCIPIVGASFIGSVMYAVGMESIISFLGLGDPNTISWGLCSTTYKRPLLCSLGHGGKYSLHVWHYPSW